MSEKKGTKKGLRCEICTGCGLCPGITPRGRADGLHILAEDALRGNRLALPDGNMRLATADIGTTTIAMLLYGRDGAVADRYVTVNPQTVYGADVLSRIRAAEEPETAEAMRKQALQALGQGLDRFLRKLAPGEELYLVIAANTTMTYLLMGWDTAELGRAPFAASHLEGAELSIGQVSCFVFPGYSAFVGGDILAGSYACGIAKKEELTLLIDLGTNGELLLGNRERQLACATAAGPAFEGGVNRGIWGADMISLLATLRREGFLDETGLLSETYFDTGIRIGNVCVTKEAVRSVQLAKAAIRAGVEILLEKWGGSADSVDRVVLAGGFGYYLDPAAAAEIGLLPEAFVEKTVTGGNTALAGALLAGRRILAEGCSAGAAEELRRYRKDAEVLNLAMEPGFQERYLQCMELK